MQVYGQQRMLRCYVTDEHLNKYLQDIAGLSKGTVILITSQEPLDMFPMVCEAYKCIHKSEFWTPEQSNIRHANTTLVQAYMDYLLAERATAFYGNVFSSFSVDLVAAFQDRNRPADYFNPDLGPAQI